MSGADQGWAAPRLTPPRSKKKAKPAAAPEPPQAEEARPEEAQPEEAQPEQAQPEQAQPEQAQPEEAQPEEAQPEEAQRAPDDTLIERAVPPLDHTTIAEAIRAEEASTDELPVIEDVTPDDRHLTATPPPGGVAEPPASAQPPASPQPPASAEPPVVAEPPATDAPVPGPTATEPPVTEPPAADAAAAEPPAAESPAPAASVVSRQDPTVQLPVIKPTPRAAAPKPPPDPASLVSPERLTEFFAPRSIAMVGASDQSAWARFVVASADATGFSGELIPVHHVRRTVFGRPAIGSLRDLTEPVDLAFILVPTDAVAAVIEDAGAAGVRGAIVLAAGYRETGDEGAALERRLADRAAAHGITLLGPNCLGFLNAHAHAGPFALTAPRPVQAGPVGIALQSGALASVILSFARARAIGISTLATLGNEAMITATDMIDYLVADENTKVICLFLEEIGDPARFAAAAERARVAGKPIVALKAGSSTVGSQAALAHTGSVAGDDAVVDAALRQMNVIRVTSIEELLTTAALLGYNRLPAGRRMGVLTASGGACDLIADQASAEGIEVPPFSGATAEAIAPHVPPFAQVRNPLDVTGYFLANQRSSALTSLDHALDAAVEDPGLEFIFFNGLTLPDARPADEEAAGRLEERVAWLGKRIATAPIPVIPVGSTCVDVTGYGRDLLEHNQIHLLGGIDLGIRAIGNAVRWAEGRDRSWAGPAVPQADSFATRAGAAAAGKVQAGNTAGPADAGPEPDDAGEAPAEGVWPEADARALLTSFQIPVVPAELTDSPQAASAAAFKLGYPVALRVSTAKLPHKSDVGGVALGLRTYTQVRSAFKRVSAAGGLAPEDIDGVLVSPMRAGGTELLAGVTVDPSFGPVLAVGLGGVWVEVFGDVSLRVLPVTQDEAVRMLGELRGSALLRGARGRQAADLGALARVICAIGDAALSLGGSLRALEVNPLWVSGDQIEALDVLVETGPRAGAAPDASAPDPGSSDAGSSDAGSPDAGSPDAGSPDAGSPDAGSPDAGSPNPLGPPPGQHRTDTRE
jgi:acetate---CoA ligase (ADP-forming)